MIVRGLEVIYPELPKDREAVPVSTQEDTPSKNIRSRNKLLATVDMSGNCPIAMQTAKR